MSNESPALKGTQGSATQTEQSITVLVEHNPSIVLLDETKRDALFAHIAEEVANFVPDMTTTKSRDECRSLAAKVTRTKTAVKEARLTLTEEARVMVKKVNESGKVIEERLKELATEARAPLTAWEDAEEKREGECKAALERLRTAAIVPMDAPADSLRTRITEVEAEPMAEDHWLGMLTLAETAKATALEALTAALTLVEQKERDAAELAELRARDEERREAEEKLRQRNEYIDSFIEHISQIGLGFIGGQAQPYGILISDLEERIPPEIETFGDRAEEVERHRVATLERVKDAMERQRERTEKEAREAEERRVKAEEAREAQSTQERAEADERTRIASKQAAQAAAEAARAEETQRAADQAAEQQRAHEAALAVERARADAAEQAQREMDEAADERDRQRRAEEQAAAAERARLEADQDRRRMVKTEAKVAIMQAGITEDQAQKVVLLILSGDVPRTFIDFSIDPPKTEGE